MRSLNLIHISKRGIYLYVATTEHNARSIVCILIGVYSSDPSKSNRRILQRKPINGRNVNRLWMYSNIRTVQPVSLAKSQKNTQREHRPTALNLKTRTYR